MKASRIFITAALVTGLWARAAAATEKPNDPFDYFVNNWNVVGLKDYPRGARVTPDNRLYLAGSNTTVLVRFGRTLTPLSHAHCK